MLTAQNLILVLGIFRRTGTNHLRDLLCFHRDCAFSKIPEDFLLAHSDILLRYAEKTSIRWGAGLKDMMPALSEVLRASLLHLLTGGDDCKRLVTKTPTVEGIENVDNIFPGAKVIVIVRDGRDTLESGRRSWEWLLPEKAAEWRSNVEKLLRFEKANPGRALRVRYEDLVTDMRGTMKVVLQHCELPEDRYKWEHAERAPVRGSSDLMMNPDKSERRMNWKPQVKAPDFSPIGRWESWSQRDRYDFDIIAGDALRALGYGAFVPQQ